MPGIHGKVWLYRSGLTLFGAIDTVWRIGTAVFGLCDAAKWSQCCQVVSIRRGSDRRALGRDPALHTPKYGHLLPTRRPRATMAT